MLASQIAGVEDEPPAPPQPKVPDSSQWARQLEKSFGQVSRSDSRGESRSTTSSRDRDRDRERERDSNPMVKIMGYAGPQGSSRSQSSAQGLDSDFGRLGLDNIAGVPRYASPHVKITHV